MRRIITISARYGAGGSVVGPKVAEELGFPFFDRAVPDASAVPDVGGGQPGGADERAGGLWGRVLQAFALMPADPSTGMLPIGNDAALRSSAEERLEEFIAGQQGVVLGWASAVVIEDGFHVRLDGPPDARLHQAMAIDGHLEEAEARRQLKETDRIRALYWRRLYGREFADRSPYHLVIDSTAVDLDTVVALVTTGARSFWSH